MIEQSMLWAFSAILTAICAIGSFLDLRDRILPNSLCAITAVLGLASVGLLHSTAEIWSAFAHGLIALLCGMTLFRFNIFGGGDAKFYAAIACWFPLNDAIALLGSTSIFAIVCAFIWLGLSIRKTKPERKSAGKKAMVPFGVPIALGGLLVFFVSGFELIPAI